MLSTPDDIIRVLEGDNDLKQVIRKGKVGVGWDVGLKLVGVFEIIYIYTQSTLLNGGNYSLSKWF